MLRKGTIYQATKINLALAYFNMGKFDLARQQCLEILKTDHANDKITFILKKIDDRTR